MDMGMPTNCNWPLHFKLSIYFIRTKNHTHPTGYRPLSFTYTQIREDCTPVSCDLVPLALIYKHHH